MGRSLRSKDSPSWLLLVRWLMNRGRESCQLCGATNDLTFDHIVPFSQGGRAAHCNLAILCGRCNVGKDCNYLDLQPVPWPHPAFGQKLAKDLTPGDHTVYGVITRTKHWETKTRRSMVTVHLSGQSIIAEMRKCEIKPFLEFDTDQIVYLHPEESNGIDLEA